MYSVSSQNPTRSNTVLTRGLIQRFHGYSRSDEAHNGRLDERETGIQIGKSKNHIRDQIRSPLDKYFWQKPKSICEKTENPQTAMNTQSQKPILKKKKPKNPMPPLRMNRTVQSTNYAHDDTTTIIISETSTKTFFKIFQSETCCKATLVTRYFSGKV